MDEQTKKHMQKWIDRMFRPEEQEAVFIKISTFINDGNDDLLQDHSWSEILRLAELN